MQTRLADFIRDTPAGREADAILRACVHCGFCTATCPTYQLLGDELDGPRGRIYQIKELLEGAPVTVKTQLHLDRCLTCRSCETTCPSGVRYSRLLDIGRSVVADRVGRSAGARLQRALLKRLLLTNWLFAPAYRLGQWLRPVLPGRLAAMVLPRRAPGVRPAARGGRRMIALAGCVQPTMAPNINAAAARVLAALGISLIEAPRAGCCGALPFHLDDVEAARDLARRNIDAWCPLLEAGAEAIVITASGCGVQVRDYAHLLADDPDYANRAARVALLASDVSEIILAEQPALLTLLAALPPVAAEQQHLAFHAPCTLQHGQGIRGVVEGLLAAAGYQLTMVPDSHLCCGSAGTYSVLQPELALRLRDNKLAALTSGRPELIVTANIGCLAHLQAGTALPVRHWIEILDARMAKRQRSGHE
ncbi:lactate utilization protein A [mine drainage metagenome]|uniref:Lactate utilization protein A n=1 Tax=mine drainage metagenome TaxID=410659 RepID=A0A1J5S6U6_9ZZZZ